MRDGRIAEIGSADKTKVPAGALQIDGRGKYLMPGLADMHVHLFPGAGAPDDLASQQLQLFLANGVTTIRNMIGKPEHLLLRDRVAKGELLGPTIYTAGPPLLGNNVPTPEAAELIVAEEKKAGYDLLKVREGLSPETYAAIVATANRVGIPFAGHVTATVGLKRALDAHQTSIEHLDGYLQAMVADDSPVKPTGSQVVVVRGRWLPESDLRKMLENVARLNASTTQGSTAKADFSGAWSLDKRNSEGLPPGMDQLMTVAVSGDKLSLETKLITEQGEQVVADSYMLNGQEVEFSPKTPDERRARANGQLN